MFDNDNEESNQRKNTQKISNKENRQKSQYASSLDATGIDASNRMRWQFELANTGDCVRRKLTSQNRGVIQIMFAHCVSLCDFVTVFRDQWNFVTLNCPTRCLDLKIY